MRSGPEERVLELTDAEQRFVFVDVEEEPLLSVGRRFSAPANFKTPMSAADRAALMARDTDRVQPLGSGPGACHRACCSRWRRPRNPASRRAPTTSMSMRIGEVLARAEEDHAFAAQMLMPPR